MTTQEVLSQLSAAIAKESMSDAMRIIDQYADEREPKEKSEGSRSKFCKLIVNGKNVGVTLPGGTPIPCILKDSLEVFQDIDLLRSGYKRVRIELLIEDETRQNTKS